jgi:hypothetical protein
MENEDYMKSDVLTAVNTQNGSLLGCDSVFLQFNICSLVEAWRNIGETLPDYCMAHSSQTLP